MRVVVDWFGFASTPSTSVYLLSPGYRVFGLPVVLNLPVQLSCRYGSCIIETVVKFCSGELFDLPLATLAFEASLDRFSFVEFSEQVREGKVLH